MLTLPSLFAFSMTSGLAGFYGGKYAVGKLRHLIPLDEDDDEVLVMESLAADVSQQSGLAPNTEAAMSKNQGTAVGHHLEATRSSSESPFSVGSVIEYFSSLKA